MHTLMRTAFLLTLSALLFACSDESGNWPQLKFEESTWSATKETERFVFVRALIEDERLLGLPKNEVIRMLGKPSYDGTDARYQTYIVKADSGHLYLLDIRYSSDASPPVVNRVFVRPD
ncbi:hypothetical protein [Duganella sp. HH105]|uniref:hypothetical protein n=1 Tax=Duganella sp. HH105 TaxID=1781067 RepID=UPI000893FA9D|nr:hypothetical protein [Duganella sp. HH105]OEZ59824.1 hypothetical protein DUGA6_34620 [Duganella sp. HH105]